MTTHTPKRRSYARRLRQVYVTTTRRERTPETFARILTNAALGKAQREAEAHADHQARLALNRSLAHADWQPEGEGVGDA